MTMNATFDRSTQDVGNIVCLEHVNLLIADQSVGHLFYCTGMGFTRDPYIDFGMRNMWMNLGRQQFHLPVGKPQVLRGVTGVVVPSLDALKARLESIAVLMEGTQFAWRQDNSHLVVTCPWGNTLEVFEPGGYGRMTLGMPYVRFDVPTGTAPGIVRFYEQIMASPAQVVQGNDGPTAKVAIGPEQSLQYRETSAEQVSYDGHHIAVYIADFSGVHQRLLERDLVTQESDASQYRFLHITDPDSGDVLFEIEHEVRSMYHPMFGRPLMNRNAAQNNRDYVQGHDAFQG
jgi:hypothetical protein